MKNLKKFAKQLWNDESGQGEVEYILLLVVVVGIVIFFGPQLKTVIKGKVDELSGGIGGVSLGE